MRLARICTVATLGLAVAVQYVTHAQNLSTDLKFEAASIKASQDPNPNGGLGPRPGGRLTAHNVPASLLIDYAYGLPSYRLAGGPGWLSTVRYDIEATASRAATNDELRAMMKSLLAERFKLVTHSEAREIDGYALVRVSDDHLGPGISPSKIDCRSRAPETAAQCAESSIRSEDPVTIFKSVGMPFRNAAAIIGSSLNAPMTDETHLEGLFDIELKYTRDDSLQSDVPLLPTAIREQLGLTLRRQKVPVDVLVVDRIERPTPN